MLFFFIFILVSIIHAGSKVDLIIKEYLQKVLSPRWELEFTEYREDQLKEAILYLAFKSYSEKKYPVIAIISQGLFDLVWPTQFKSAVVQLLTNYPDRKCMHIWAENISLNTVKRYSSAMVAESPAFRKVGFNDLTAKDDETALKEISEKVISKLILLNI